MFNPAQYRAARAALGLTVREVCTLAGMGEGTVVKIEAGDDVRPASAAKLRAVYAESGVVFGDDGRRVSW